MNRRKIARWTLGPVSQDGIDILRESIRTFSRLYPEFERWVCYNHIEPENFDANLLKQQNCFFNLREPDLEEKWEPVGCGWKLVPPRIDINAYELFLDNDVVFTDRIPTIGNWLNSNLPMISRDIFRIFGRFDHLVQDGLQVCAGLFGMPPNFDFESKIKNILGEEHEPFGGFSEQGLTAAVITNHEGWIENPDFFVSKEDVPVPFPPVIHFATANRKRHLGWEKYKVARMRFL